MKIIHIYTYLIFTVLWGNFTESKAQDLNKIDVKKPLVITGGISASQTLYTSEGIKARRDPYYWLLSANLNINLFGLINVPLSGQLTQQNKSYTQPFNQYGLSPTYKCWTAHLGYRSLQYSSYSVGGNQWYGAGLEYVGKKVPITASAFWGRFQRAVGAFTQEGVVGGEYAFERYGLGAKIGYQGAGRSYSFVFFRAKDNASSLQRSFTDTVNLKPAENVVLSLLVKQPLHKKILLEVEYATSAYTINSYIDREQTDYLLINRTGTLFKYNASTQVNNALVSSLAWSQPKYQVKLAYKRIDPEYKTMGSVFLNNDVEDISAGVSWKMLKQRININTNYGVQRNNLDKKLTQEMFRNAFSSTLSASLTKKLGLSISYSNFMSETKFNNTNLTANQLSLNQSSDSLKYNQITESGNMGITYAFGDSVKHSVNTTSAIQNAKDSKNNNSTFYNASVGYTLALPKRKFSCGINAIVTQSNMLTIKSETFGPSLNISKIYFKTLRFSYSAMYASNYVKSSIVGYTLNHRFGTFVKIKKTHGVSSDINFMSRTITQKTVKEIRASLVYTFSF
jgi:hypothetical protein